MRYPEIEISTTRKSLETNIERKLGRDVICIEIIMKYNYMYDI